MSIKQLTFFMYPWNFGPPSGNADIPDEILTLPYNLEHFITAFQENTDAEIVVKTEERTITEPILRGFIMLEEGWPLNGFFGRYDLKSDNSLFRQVFAFDNIEYGDDLDNIWPVAGFMPSLFYKIWCSSLRHRILSEALGNNWVDYDPRGMHELVGHKVVIEKLRKGAKQFRPISKKYALLLSLENQTFPQLILEYFEAYNAFYQLNL
ncbi:hypothetical protein [Candidatus Leptofilum sp.]|uniref:hypothetical protein n=1 Tax=Candidatus Leptofilum sp. TaxID=3241576 RepID=UPI003B5C7A8A